ncbi:MAG: response regulator [Geobacteraceae bacterium]
MIKGKSKHTEHRDIIMMSKKHLGDLLVDAGIITVKTLERALERQKGSGKRLGVVLEEMGVVTEGELVTALSKQLDLKTVRDIASHSFPRDLLDLVSEDIAVQRLVFPLRLKEGTLALAVNDPFDNDTLDYIAKKTALKIIPVLASRDDIMAAVKKYYLRDGSQTHDKLKLLVVDDSQSIATIIQVALQKEGYEVMTANDGVEGLKMALTHNPDLIICDSVMPRMDGFGLLRALRATPSFANTPMILLTSKATGEDEQRALEVGFLDFISKPVQTIRIVSRVKRAFELMGKFK